MFAFFLKRDYWRLSYLATSEIIIKFLRRNLLAVKDNSVQTSNAFGGSKFRNEIKKILKEENKTDSLFECPFTQNKSSQFKDSKAYTDLCLTILEILECKSPDVFIKLFYNNKELGTLLWEVTAASVPKDEYIFLATFRVLNSLEDYFKDKYASESASLQKN